MQMIDVMKRLAELDANNPNIVNPTKPTAKEELVVETITEGRRDMALPNMPEPNLLDLRALSGVKKLNESAIAECGMMPMGAPMPSLPASLNMSAGNAGEIVAMMRGIMDLAKGDVPTQTSMPAMGAPMPGMMGDLDRDGDHDMTDHGLEKQPLFAEPETKVSGPTFGSDGPANAEPVDTDDLGGDDVMGGMGDELADIVKKIKTGQPVKITTDMPVKVSSDEPIKGTTDQQAKVKDEAEGYDNSPKPQTKGFGGGDDFANIINKVRVADMAKTPSGSGSNPMPDEEDDREKTPPMETFEAKLMAEYQKFVSEGEKTMSRAAKGYEKYGKKGMKALSDAGKEGKDLEPVRAKYNKYD
jgi:hypothetical protein